MATGVMSTKFQHESSFQQGIAFLAGGVLSFSCQIRSIRQVLKLLVSKLVRFSFLSSNQSLVESWDYWGPKPTRPKAEALNKSYSMTDSLVCVLHNKYKFKRE